MYFKTLYENNATIIENAGRCLPLGACTGLVFNIMNEEQGHLLIVHSNPFYYYPREMYEVLLTKAFAYKLIYDVVNPVISIKFI